MVRDQKKLTSFEMISKDYLLIFPIDVREKLLILHNLFYIREQNINTILSS